MVKFKGKFRDLKPLGYTFNNHDGYSYNKQEEEFSDRNSLTIFVKQNLITIGYWNYTQSSLILNSIINNSYKEHINEYNEFVINLLNKDVETFDYNIHNATFSKQAFKWQDLRNKLKNPVEVEQAKQDFKKEGERIYKTYLVINLDEYLLTSIKELIKLNLI